MSDRVFLCDLSLAPDIGLALTVPGRRPDAVKRFSCTNRQAFDNEVKQFLTEAGRPNLLGAALAARGWEQKGELHIYGLGFTLDRDDIRDLLGVQRVNFVNNFVARALAVPGLRRDEKIHISGDAGSDDHAISVMGPHFGLGLASLVSDGVGGWTALHGEGGHSDLPAANEHEWRLIEAIRAKTGYVSRESGISVAGLMDIWYALHVTAGEEVPPLTSAAIIDAARWGNARAIAAIDMMTTWLAAMASDIALIMGASGGIYLTGALLDMLGELFDAEKFRERYLAKGPLSDYVRAIPVFRTMATEMEIRGLATLYD